MDGLIFPLILLELYVVTMYLQFLKVMSIENYARNIKWETKAINCVMLK